jgi:acyl carrier protein phosphodiesterase
MNYLAHLKLADKTTESRIGNLLGDMVKGPLDSLTGTYSEGILKGIKTHRHIDMFTDQHEIYIKSKRRISSDYRRFSGVIIDICYDHFLSRHWHLFSYESLDNFIQSSYELLKTNEHVLPANFRRILPSMIEQNWLGSYQTLEGIDLTFTRMSYRLKRENNLASSQQELLKNYAELEADFLEFFPVLMEYAKTMY